MTIAQEASLQMKRAIARTKFLNTCGLTIDRRFKQSKLIWRDYLTGEDTTIAIVSTFEELMTVAEVALGVVKAARAKARSRERRKAA
jgi:hypothetical protein